MFAVYIGFFPPPIIFLFCLILLFPLSYECSAALPFGHLFTQHVYPLHTAHPILKAQRGSTCSFDCLDVLTLPANVLNELRINKHCGP